MKRIFFSTLIATLLVPLAALAQSSDVGVNGVLVSPAASPVKLELCNIQPGSPTWSIQVGLTNRGTVPISAVKIRFQHEDAFGEVLQTDVITAQGPFEPHKTYYPADPNQPSDAPALYWTVGDTHMPSSANFSKERCTVMATIDSAGKVWKYKGM